MWSDAGPSSNVANLLPMDGVGYPMDLESSETFIPEPAVRTTHQHDLTGLQSLEILCHKTALRELRMHLLPVNFDDEVDVSLIFNL